MAEASLHSGRVAYDVVGPPDAPLLVLIGSLGTNRHVWDAQMGPFGNWFRVLRIEHPGHDGLPAPRGPYSVEGLGERVVDLLDILGEDRAHFAGLSLGGMIVMWLAAVHPDRVERIAVCCSAPRFPPPGPWLERAAKVRAEGTGSLKEAALERWFTPAFLSEQPEVVDRFVTSLSSVDDAGYASCCEALSAADVTSQLGLIRAPTLVLGGAQDPVVPPASAAATMTAIPGATLCVLAGAAHLPNVVQPDAFNSVVLQHFAGRPEERGVAVRRAVMGDAHVDRALSAASELTAPFQEFLANGPWGEVWARPGLDRQTRRLVAIAILVALGRREELEMHVRQALRAGLSTVVLREVLLQTAVYAGVPAANSAFAIADRVLGEVSGPGEGG
jgi:3-oxoadipate enol-lactonase/4-carboxymuconolactone decarboxylase